MRDSFDVKKKKPKIGEAYVGSYEMQPSDFDVKSSEEPTRWCENDFTI